MASITKRQWSQNGKPRWEARVSIGGKSTSKSFGTKSEAVAWAKEREGIKSSGTRTDNKLLSVAVTAWVDGATGSTRAGRNHLAHNLGDLGLKKVGDVQKENVQAWRRLLAKGRPWENGKPLSAGTVATLTRHLSAFFNEQVAAGQITRNPVLGARGGDGAVSKKAVKVVEPATLLTLDQVRALRDAAPEPLRTMIELMATTGMRPGEIGGLKVQSVDLDTASVHVINQADGLYGDWSWTELKSERSRRSIPLPQSTVDAIRAHLDRHPDYAAASPLFRTERDYQWSTAHIGSQFAKVTRALQITGHSPKSFRHFYASKLIRAGEPVNVVQARLGHASADVTLAVYTHLWHDAHDTTRAAVADVF